MGLGVERVFGLRDLEGHVDPTKTTTTNHRTPNHQLATRSHVETTKRFGGKDAPTRSRVNKELVAIGLTTWHQSPSISKRALTNCVWMLGSKLAAAQRMRNGMTPR